MGRRRRKGGRQRTQRGTAAAKADPKAPSVALGSTTSAAAATHGPWSWVLSLIALAITAAARRVPAVVWVTDSVAAIFLWRGLANLGFIERMAADRRWKVRAVSLVVLLVGSGYVSWSLTRPEPTREQILDELAGYHRASAWPTLSARLESLERDPALSDVANYYRAVICLNSKPEEDPERYLVAIPSGSSLFRDAQWLRVEATARRPHEEHEARNKAILETLERVRDRSPLYYRVRAGEGPQPFSQAQAVYEEFEHTFAGQFDFARMQASSQLPNGQVGSPYHVNVSDFLQIPACAAFLLYRQMQAAGLECRQAEKDSAAVRISLLARNQGNHLGFWLRSIRIDPNLAMRASELALTPLPADCNGRPGVSNDSNGRAPHSLASRKSASP